MDKTQATNFKLYQPSLIHLNPNSDSLMMDQLVDLLDDIPDNEEEYIPQKNHRNSWNEESNEGWTSTGVMSDRSSVYSIDDAVCTSCSYFFLYQLFFLFFRILTERRLKRLIIN